MRHVFLLGPSGTGKSTLIISILRQLSQDRVPWWAVDFKRNYRCLLADPHGKATLVFTLGRSLAPLSLNVLAAPHGVERNSWVEALADIICTAYLLLHGARNVLKNALLGAISDKGDHATLRDALHLVANELVRSRQGSRRYGWLESTHRSLEELSTGALGDSLNATNPLSLRELLTVPVVFELEGLGEDQQRFVALFFLQSVLFLRKHETVPREVLRHVLIFDEAHNIFRKDQWGELSLPSTLAREVREYGEALISATQQADVADSLIANSGTKIILRCDHPKDVDFTSKLLQVDGRWVSKIPVGHGIARLATRYYQSFLFTFPEQPIKNTLISEDRVQQRYAQWTTNLISRRARHDPTLKAARRDLEAWARTTNSTTSSVSPLFDAINATAETNDIANTLVSERTPDTTAFDAISEKERTLLTDIATHPISTVTERYARLQWNPKTGNVVKDSIIKHEYARFEVIAVPPGSVKLLALTVAGERFVGKTARPLHHGGMEHEFWRQRLRERCERRGCLVQEEYDVGGGKRVDLLARQRERSFYIEVETGKSDVHGNIAKCQGQGATLIVFFTSIGALRRATAQRTMPKDVVLLSPETIRQLHDLIR